MKPQDWRLRVPSESSRVDRAHCFIVRTLIITLFCYVGICAFAQMDTNLVREIKTWRRGDAPPAWLLKFPDGKIDLSVECGLRVSGSAVEDYILGIQNPDLLAALVFDRHSQAETVHAAVSQLIRIKGVSYVSRLIAERRQAEPSTFSRPELAVRAQLLRAPYVAVQVAFIATKDMQLEKAEPVLRQMSKELDAGMSWVDAYRKFSDLNLDLRDRATEPKSTRTLICYLYDSTVSPDGFDIVNYRMAENLPLEHLREVFRAKRGTLVLRATGGVYLYHITSYYDDAAKK
jgi:hypothetical protein